MLGLTKAGGKKREWGGGGGGAYEIFQHIHVLCNILVNSILLTLLNLFYISLCEITIVVAILHYIRWETCCSDYNRGWGGDLLQEGGDPMRGRGEGV